MILNHNLHIAHDLRVSSMSILSHLGNAITEDAIGLRVKHERHCEQTLDPF
jgi:hypothetical protein